MEPLDELTAKYRAELTLTAEMYQRDYKQVTVQMARCDYGSSGHRSSTVALGRFDYGSDGQNLRVLADNLDGAAQKHKRLRELRAHV